jgi:hypothetical protein
MTEIEELRARVEALEADQLEQAESNRFCIDAIVRRVEALEGRPTIEPQPQPGKRDHLKVALETTYGTAPIVVPSPAGSLVERVSPTDKDLLEIRDDAYCPAVDEANDEDDSMWQYTSNYTDWLYTNGTIQERQAYEAKGLRAVFNAGRRAAELDGGTTTPTES